MSNKTIKQQLYAKYKVVPCLYCFKPLTKDEATIEHIVPKSKGGSNKKHNTAICCRSCNELKSKEHQLLSRIENIQENIKSQTQKEKELWRQYESVVESIKKRRDKNLDLINRNIK